MITSTMSAKGRTAARRCGGSSGCLPAVIALGSTPEGVMSHGEKSLLAPSGRAPSPCEFGSSGRGPTTHRRESLTVPVSLPLGSNAVHPMV